MRNHVSTCGCIRVQIAMKIWGSHGPGKDMRWILRSSFLRKLACDYFSKECVIFNDSELIIPTSACNGIEVCRLQNAGKSKSNQLVQLSCVCMQLKTFASKRVIHVFQVAIEDQVWFVRHFCN